MELPLYNEEAAARDFADYFGWDYDLYEKPQWEVEYDCSDLGEQAESRYRSYLDDYGDVVPFTVHRGSAYTTDDFADMVVLTGKYLGISDSYGVRSGGLRMAEVAREEARKCAAGEPGTFEDPPQSNDTKYAAWCLGGPGPWCASFVAWCADRCGYIDSGLFRKTGGCTFQYYHLTDDMGFESVPVSQTTTFGGGSYTPVPGDIIFFYRGRSSDSYPGRRRYEHVGIVVENGPGALHVVEGNTSGFGAVPGGGVWENVYTQAMYDAGGWMRAAEIVHVLYPGSGTGGGTDCCAEQLYQLLKSEWGLTDAACLGPIMVSCHESSLVPDKLERGAAQGFGLFAWTDNSRSGLWGWQALREFAQENHLLWNTAECQLRFFTLYYTSGYRGSRGLYKSAWPASGSTAEKLQALGNTTEDALESLRIAAAASGGGYNGVGGMYEELRNMVFTPGYKFYRSDVSVAPWPNLAQWVAEFQQSGQHRSDHQLEEEAGWSGQLFQGDEQWDYTQTAYSGFSSPYPLW